MVGGELTDADRAYDERRKAQDQDRRDKAARKRRIAARDRARESKPKRVERVKA